MTSPTRLDSETTDFLETFCKHVAEDFKVLATLHEHEPEAALLKELKELNFPYGLTLLMDSKPATEAMALMHKSLSDLPEDPSESILDELAADYASIYLNHNIGVSPEESVWLDEHNLICQESMFQVRSWYERYNLVIPDWRLRPDDHLVYELQFIAWLLDHDHQPETLEQVAIFMDEHLLRWLGNFASGVLSRCDTLYFAGSAALTAAYCEELRDILAIELQQPRPSVEEIEERMQIKPPVQEVPVKFMPGIGPAV